MAKHGFTITTKKTRVRIGKRIFNIGVRRVVDTDLKRTEYLVFDADAKAAKSFWHMLGEIVVNKSGSTTLQLATGSVREYQYRYERGITWRGAKAKSPAAAFEKIITMCAKHGTLTKYVPGV